MYKWKGLIIICICFFFLAGCSSEKREVKLTVSAAASLTDAMEELVEAFESEESNIAISLNLASSGALQQQISQGAPVDIFLSAAEEPFDYLNKQGLLDKSHQELLLRNQLVLIKRKDSFSQFREFKDLLDEQVQEIAIGTPESVPAGIYAKQALEHVGIFHSLESKLVYAKDVRQVLQYVESGSVDFGFVYSTDVITAKQVEVERVVDEEWHDPIQYPIGILKDTKHKEEAVAFYNFLRSAKADTIFAKYGFTTVNK
jgi:molybdate transport system substrate-binding protein